MLFLRFFCYEVCFALNNLGSYFKCWCHGGRYYFKVGSGCWYCYYFDGFKSFLDVFENFLVSVGVIEQFLVLHFDLGGC